MVALGADDGEEGGQADLHQGRGPHGDGDNHSLPLTHSDRSQTEVNLEKNENLSSSQWSQYSRVGKG